MPRDLPVHPRQGQPGRRRTGGVPMRMRSAILHYVIGALVVLGALAHSAPAQAAPISCGFTITNLNFGTVDLTLNTTIDSTATLSANCTGDAGTVVRVCPNINAGSGGTTTGSPRFMLSGSDKLNFDLYQDAARTVVWGSYLWAHSSYTAPTIDITLNGGGSGSATATIYGRIRQRATGAAAWQLFVVLQRQQHPDRLCSSRRRDLRGDRQFERDRGGLHGERRL